MGCIGLGNLGSHSLPKGVATWKKNGLLFEGFLFLPFFFGWFPQLATAFFWWEVASKDQVLVVIQVQRQVKCQLRNYHLLSFNDF